MNQPAQSIRAKAFRRELVPQDPADEPASELLERIREERRKQAAERSPGRRGLHMLPIGTELRVGGGVLLKITQIGKVCHDRCAIFQQVGDCVMPREGVFAEVLAGGEIKIGDIIEVFE